MTTNTPQPTTALAYVYLIAFRYTTEDEPSKERTDNDSVASREQLTTFKQIEDVQAYILNDHKDKGWRTVKITGFQFLECTIAAFKPNAPA